MALLCDRSAWTYEALLGILWAGCSYVALGETELAVKALREVLDRQPDFQFDPVQTSPKIRAALAQARAEN